MPAIRLKSVLLPQPDGPTIETKSPRWTCRETSCSASTGRRPPKDLLTFRTSRTGCCRLVRSGCTVLGAVAQAARRFEELVREERSATKFAADRLVVAVDDHALADQPVRVGVPLFGVLHTPVAVGGQHRWTQLDARKPHHVRLRESLGAYVVAEDFGGLLGVLSCKLVAALRSGDELAHRPLFLLNVFLVGDQDHAGEVGNAKVIVAEGAQLDA